jgi:ribosome-associated protein
MASEAGTVTLRGDHVTLAQALKIVGFASTGGQAKILIREGGVEVNGEAESRPGRKLRAGDRIRTPEGEWVVVAP